MRRWTFALLGHAVSHTGAQPRDVALACHTFMAFFYVLASYFLMLPLREEAAMQLGTDTIPKLFTASLLVTLVVAPMVSSMLSRIGSNRARGHQQLFVVLAAVLFAFYAAFTLAPLERLPNLNADVTFDGGPELSVSLVADPPHSSSSIRRLMQQPQQQQPQLQQEQQPAIPQALDGSAHHPQRGRAHDPATGMRAWLLTAFYVWHGVQNLVAMSALWALAADIFTPDAGARLFGFLTAGATAGQLSGSLMSMGFVVASRRWSGGIMGPPVLLLPGSALLMLLAARCCHTIGATASSSKALLEGRQGSSSRDNSGGGGSLPGDGGEYAGYAAVSGSSATNAAGPQVVGRVGQRASFGGFPPSPSSAQPHHPSRGLRGEELSRGFSAPADTLPHRSHVALPAALAALDGFRLILASPFLLLLCCFLLMGSMVSSVIYFERAVVVAATMQDSGQRSTFFAALNSCTALFVFTLQLLAAGNVTRRLGVTATLCILPALSLAGVALIAAFPTPTWIAGVEVARKVVQHTLSRPARELIFTVMSREEKYKAKVIIDSVVLRLGDALAAAIFQVLDVQMGLGPSVMALVGTGICVCWVITALQLGHLYCRRAALHQDRLLGWDESASHTT